MFRKILWVALGVVVGGLALDLVVCLVYPDVALLSRRNPEKTAFMEARETEWLRQGKKKAFQQRWVPLRRISPYAVKAVIIAEDDKFWAHEGFDFEAIQKALAKDLRRRAFRVGGSTISQQLAKNLYLTAAKTPLRKLKEAILTWRLERNLSKRRIIELYLNVAEWGDGIFGVEAAARHHFGKAAADLSALEAARLAAVLPSPRRLDPAGESRYVAARADLIYRIMVRRGVVVFEEENDLPAPAGGAEERPGTPEEGSPTDRGDPSPAIPERDGPRPDAPGRPLPPADGKE